MLSKLRRRLLLVWGLLAASLIPTLVQLFAMLVLDPADFGVLVLVYLPLSLGNSVAFSLVCEPWATRGAPREEKAEYDTVLLALSMLAGFASICIGAFLGVAAVGGIVGFAVGCSVFRLGSRYASVVNRRNRYIAPPDSFGLCMLVGAFAVVTFLGASLLAIAVAWGLSAAVAAVLSEPISLPKSFGKVRRWLASYWNQSRVLLTDAMLTEAGTVGIPFILAPMMGVAEFGVFRAAASVTAPVRMVLNPLRPYIAKQPISSMASLRVTLSALLIAIVAGICAWGALLAVRMSGVLEGSAISSLSMSAIPVGVYVAFYAVSVFSYYILRTHVGGRSLMRYRIWQLCLQLAGPTAGYALGGVSGAIYGRALAFGGGFAQSTASLRSHKGTG